MIGELAARGPHWDRIVDIALLAETYMEMLTTATPYRAAIRDVLANDDDHISTVAANLTPVLSEALDSVTVDEMVPVSVARDLAGRLYAAGVNETLHAAVPLIYYLAHSIGDLQGASTADVLRVLKGVLTDGGELQAEA